MGTDSAKIKLLPLIVEVFLSILLYLSIYCIISISCLAQPNLHFQALQMICLSDHIRKMVDQLHADAIQQLEVAQLG